METQTSLRLPSELLAQIDAWRKDQPLKPNRAQAIRWFIEYALERHTNIEPAARSP